MDDSRMTKRQLERELRITNIQLQTACSVASRLAQTMERAGMALENHEDPLLIAEDLAEALEDTTARLQEVS